MPTGRTSQIFRYAPPAIAALLIFLCAFSTYVSLRQIFASYQTIFFSDQWDTVEFLDKVLRGAASLNDFAAQHNEHRILIPRLIFVLDMFFAGARNTVNYATILLCQALHAVLFHRLIAQRIKDRALQWALTGFVTLLLLCIVQWENLTWGFQIGFVGVFLFYTLAAYMLASAQASFPAASRTFAVISGLAVGASAAFMISNGAAALLCIGLILLIAGFFNLITGAVIAAGVAVIGLYVGYFTPIAGHTSLSAALGNPVAYLEYVCVYLGSFFAPLDIIVARITGFIGLALSALAALALLTGRLAPDRVNLTLVAILAFVVLTAAATGFGRVSFGVEQAASSRYATPSAVFWAALGTLIVCTLHDARPAGRRWPALVALIALTLVALTAAGRSLTDYAGQLADRNRAMRAVTDSILSDIPNPVLLKIVYPDTKRMQETLLPLARARRFNIFSDTPPFALGTRVPADKLASGPAECIGHLDGFNRLPGPPDALALNGWAWNVRDGQPLDRVVFLSGDRQVIGYGSITTGRGDVWAHHPPSKGKRVAWLGFVSADVGRVVAYGIARDGTALCQIGESEVR